MEVSSDRRQQARALADELLGRSARVARGAIGPLGFLGRVFLAAGLVVWLAGPAPVWDSPPSPVFSVIALVLLALPGVRLLRHRARLSTVLEELPALIDNLTGALTESTAGLEGLAGRWAESGSEHKAGAFAAGRRCYRFYRQDLAPLRKGPGRVVEQVTDLLAAFSAPALILTGLALAFGLAEIVLVPIAVIIRLIVG